jgi:AAA domain
MHLLAKFRHPVAKTHIPNIQYLKVITIDASLGVKEDIVIILSSRAGVDNDPGFLVETNRLNLALTRGRFDRTFIGDTEFIRQRGNDSLLRRFLDFQTAADLVVDVHVPGYQQPQDNCKFLSCTFYLKYFSNLSSVAGEQAAAAARRDGEEVAAAVLPPAPAMVEDIPIPAEMYARAIGALQFFADHDFNE